MPTTFNGRKIALGFGLFYTAIGALGIVPGLAVATGQPGQSLLFGLLGTSAALGLVHLGIGLIAIWASQTRTSVRQALTGLTAVFALLVGAAWSVRSRRRSG